MPTPAKSNQTQRIHQNGVLKQNMKYERVNLIDEHVAFTGTLDWALLGDKV